MTESNLPPDPFKTDSGDDLAQFAAGCFAMHTAFMASGFSDSQALRLTSDLMAAMMAAQMKAKN